MTNPTLATLSVNGKLESGLKNSVQVRDLPAFIVDEPERLGGTNAGPNPLEYFLGALSACTSIILSYTAKDLNFSYQDVTYSTDGTLDPRGFKGVEGVLTYFQSVKIDIVVETEESDEALQKLAETVEQRCPLYNLLIDAGVEVKSNWVKK
ncbi:OsmC family protein [Oceanobacillus bengalensis]|uniref:OsmC family peroxiredoxin n=1 Tax=Oceanobacillus bengalensis TaxID=1435466 RepID=A0A494Z256_9BACI|nr:OsmC family protein [Oceanobacillus bengalensis]RKQ16620.1 OsmC family peroxiredoxin [Oceanobacillus bengalensis]